MLGRDTTTTPLLAVPCGRNQKTSNIVYEEQEENLSNIYRNIFFTVSINLCPYVTDVFVYSNCLFTAIHFVIYFFCGMLLENLSGYCFIYSYGNTRLTLLASLIIV